MQIRELDGTARSMRIALAALICAVIILSVALIFAVSHLSTMKAQLTAMQTWQSGILRQLGEALQRAGSARPLDPAEASEALADIVASRDSARLLLTQRTPEPDLPSVPSSSEDTVAPSNIASLTRRASTGVAGEDAAAIDRDSQTPWNDWK